MLCADEKSFKSLLVLDGAAELTSAYGATSLKKGDSVFVDAGTGSFTVSGRADIIITDIV